MKASSSPLANPPEYFYKYDSRLYSSPRSPPTHARVTLAIVKAAKTTG